MGSEGILWRLSDGSIIEVGHVNCTKGDLFWKQFYMSGAGDKDTACTSLSHVSNCGFDRDRFVLPEECDYRMSFSTQNHHRAAVGVRHSGLEASDG